MPTATPPCLVDAPPPPPTACSDRSDRAFDLITSPNISQSTMQATRLVSSHSVTSLMAVEADTRVPAASPTTPQGIATTPPSPQIKITFNIFLKWVHGYKSFLTEKLHGTSSVRIVRSKILTQRDFSKMITRETGAPEEAKVFVKTKDGSEVLIYEADELKCVVELEDELIIDLWLDTESAKGLKFKCPKKTSFSSAESDTSVKVKKERDV